MRRVSTTQRDKLAHDRRRTACMRRRHAARVGRVRVRRRSRRVRRLSISSSTTRDRRKPRRSRRPIMALWQRMLDVNLTGVFLCTRAVLPGMLERGSGRIVNVASTAGQIGYAYVAAYCAAKHGVIGMTRSLALEVATKGVTVNAVCPGYTETELLRASLEQITARPRAAKTGARHLAAQQSATSLRHARASRQCGPVAVPARLRRHHGPIHFHLRWRSNVTKSASIKTPHAAGSKPQRKGVAKPAENVVDLEMSTGVDSHMGLRLWLRMLTTTNLVQAELRKRLRNEFDTTLPRFDLMAQLERHPEGLKMTELSRRLMVTGGNITGITDQLEKEGLVVRDTDPNDRRSYQRVSHADGRKAFDRMAVAHEQWVVELFGGLQLDEKSRTHQTLGKLKQHLLDISSLTQRSGSNRSMEQQETSMTRSHADALAGRQPPDACGLRRRTLRLVGRRQGRDDHAEPSRTQEPADFRIVCRVARPVPATRLRDRRQGRRDSRRRRQLLFGRRRARHHRAARSICRCRNCCCSRA